MKDNEMINYIFPTAAYRYIIVSVSRDYGNGISNEMNFNLNEIISKHALIVLIQLQWNRLY